LEFLATTEVGLRGRNLKARQMAGDEDDRGEWTGDDEDEEDDEDEDEEGDGPKVRARSRSPGYDVTNFLCIFIFLFTGASGGRPHQLATAGRR
jgi:hypothetical protein